MNLASGSPTPAVDSRHSSDDTSFIPAFVVDRFVEEWESTGRPPDFAYWLFRKLEEDLLALERVTSHESEPIMAI